MKPISKRVIIGLLLVGVLLVGGIVWARLPRPTPARGVVFLVEREPKRLTVRTEGTKRPMVLTWTDRTPFIKNGKTVASELPREGDKVTVYYIESGFGPIWLKKLEWDESSKTEGKEP